MHGEAVYGCYNFEKREIETNNLFLFSAKEKAFILEFEFLVSQIIVEGFWIRMHEISLAKHGEALKNSWEISTCSVNNLHFSSKLLLSIIL